MNCSEELLLRSIVILLIYPLTLSHHSALGWHHPPEPGAQDGSGHESRRYSPRTALLGTKASTSPLRVIC